LLRPTRFVTGEIWKTEKKKIRAVEKIGTIETQSLFEEGPGEEGSMFH
jgi:hypothetical protein